MDYLFLELEELLRIHQAQIERYGGSAGVRDMGLVQSALATPKASFGGLYLHTDIFEMAAAYLYHIVQGHPFVDGNKRAGAAATDVFLLMNGIEITALPMDFEKLVLAVANQKTHKSDVALFLRRNSRAEDQ